MFPHRSVTTDGSLSCEASRDALEAALEALDIPFAATVGDDEIRMKILEHRLGYTVVMLKSILREEYPTPDAAWSIEYLRDRLAEHPAVGYKTWDERVAELDAMKALDAARSADQLAERAMDIIGRGEAARMSGVRRWPLFLIAAPAAVAVWSGWVGLGGMCGFGVVHPLPGILPGFQLDTAITLPIGVEAYGAYALGAWLAPAGVPETARRFARRSAVGALGLGCSARWSTTCCPLPTPHAPPGRSWCSCRACRC